MSEEIIKKHMNGTISARNIIKYYDNTPNKNTNQLVSSGSSIKNIAPFLLFLA